MVQFGFFIDQSRCIGCNSCVIACKQWHDIPPGPVKWIRVFQWEEGFFPDVRLHILPVMCFHCENPICLKVCPQGALYKEEKYGAVLVQTEKCKGTRKCWLACPYGTPQYGGDELQLKMSKCNMCIDRLNQGLKPICVLSCSMRALEFGPIDEMIKRYGHLRQLKDMPKASITRPSVVFRPANLKKHIVPYDSEKALELWQKRQRDQGEVLPDVFRNKLEVTNIPQEIVGRSRLALKTKSAKELMYFTTDDE